MYKLSSILHSFFWCIFALAFAHWMQLEPGEPFFTFRSSHFPGLFVIIAGELVAIFSTRNARLKYYKDLYDRFMQNKWLLLVCSAALLALCGYVLVEGYQREASAKVIIMSWAGLLLFGLGTFIFLRGLIGGKKAPQYATDSQYLYILMPFRRTPVEWKHITHFSIVKVAQASNQTFVAVHIDNAGELMDNASGMIARKGYEFTIPQYGTPYFIPAERCALTPGQLLDQLNQELAHHKHINPNTSLV